MAFGQDLKKTKIRTKLYRKVDSSNFLKEGEICFSTEKSSTLIENGDFCIVLEKDEYEGLYDNKDADAGKNFGYDEFRVNFFKEELIDKIDAIVVPNWWEDDIEEEKYGTDEDPMEWIENLSNFGKVIFQHNYRDKINFNF